MFGPAYKGIPLVVVTAIAYSELYGKEIRYCSDRKEEKDHGADKGSFLGSSLKDGDRVIMIEDVTTSGKSMEETVPKVKGAADVTIVGLMVSLNRMEVGKGGEKCALDEVKDLYGFETAAIVSHGGSGGASLQQGMPGSYCDQTRDQSCHRRILSGVWCKIVRSRKELLFMGEKIYNTMKQAGALNVTLGIVSLAVGVASGILLIIHGAKLLKRKGDVLI